MIFKTALLATALAALLVSPADAVQRDRPRTCMFELPEEVVARDAVTVALGGEFNEQNVAAGHGWGPDAATGKIVPVPIDVAAELAARRTALDKVEASARGLPESRVKVAYLCAVEMQRRQLVAAADEQGSGKLRKRLDDAKRARDTVTVPAAR